MKAPVNCAAGPEGEANFGWTSVAAPKPASLSLARYCLTARLAAAGSTSLFHSARDRALTVGVGFDQARIDHEALTADQIGLDTRPHHALEHDSENIALWKRALRAREKAEWSGDGVFQIQLTEPPLGEVHLNLPANLPL
jgi:hypothetical protein